jgi:hypothetical protein
LRFARQAKRLESTQAANSAHPANLANRKTAQPVFMRHTRHFRPVGRINTGCRLFGIVGIAGNTATIKARDALATCRLLQAWRSLPVPLLCAAIVRRC